MEFQKHKTLLGPQPGPSLQLGKTVPLPVTWGRGGQGTDQGKVRANMAGVITGHLSCRPQGCGHLTGTTFSRGVPLNAGHFREVPVLRIIR